MTPPLRLFLALAVAAVTLLFVLTRPRGWHEAQWTAGGSAPMPLLLASLLGRSGFFDWSPIPLTLRAVLLALWPSLRALP